MITLTGLRRRWPCWLPAVVCLAIVGCGKGRPKTYSVSGRVLVDGKPLNRGDIRLLGEKFMGASAIGTDGSFTISTFGEQDGVPADTYKVEVIAYDFPSPGTVCNLVPQRYLQAATSDKTVEITGSTSSLEINLQWGRERPVVEKQRSR